MARATVLLAALALGFSGLACPSPTPMPTPSPTAAPTLTPEQARAETVLFAKGIVEVRREHQRQVAERTAFSAQVADMAPDVSIERFTDFLEQNAQLYSRVSEIKTPSTVKGALVHGLYLSAFAKEKETLAELFQGLLFGDVARIDKGAGMGRETEALFRQAESAFQDLLDAYGIPQAEIGN